MEELILGRYRLRRRLGTGGFASVWLARDERLERDVAVKLLARDRIVGGRFEREARATARLNHPGIVTLYEAAVDDDGAYLVSELVRGSTLGRLLQEGHLSDRDVGLSAIALCDALHYAHDQGVVHRDVKPSNILMPGQPHTMADVAKLTDFGVAHVIGGDSLTRTGDVIGTTAYMSPEQAEGREVQPSADLYSLGVVIYEALSGVNPLRLSDPGVRGGRLGAHLPPLRRPRRDLPRELGCAVDLALRPRPRERGTIAELRAALSASVDRLDDRPGIVAVPSSSWTRTETPVPGPRPRWTERSVGVSPGRATPRARPELSTARPRRSRGRTDLPKDRGEAAGARPRLPWPGRLTAAAAAAAATLWFTATLLSSSAALPLVAMGAAAVLAAALPRLGWIALVATGAVLLVLRGSPGAGLVLVLAALPAMFLLLRRPTRWPLAACVPALAAIGLPGLWPALAGRTGSAWQRVILGGAGWLWLVAGEVLGGSGLYFTLPAQISQPSTWTPSVYDTYHQVLHSLVATGLLVPAVVWGMGALLLPHAEGTGRRVAAVLVWGLVLTALTGALLTVLRTGAALRPLPAILGALACAALAAIPQNARGLVRGQRGSTPPLDSRSMETR
jgi:serine/threonine protein kinase